MRDPEKREDYLMYMDPEAPGLIRLLKGEGRLGARILAWGFICIIAPLILGAILAML